MPIQTRHPVAMAQQALSNQAVCEGRFTLGLGPSHHWIVEDMLGLPYDKPARLVRSYIEVLNAAFAGPGPVDVENDDYRIHNPLDITDITPTPILVAALAPVMLRIAGELASGTILWMADERAIGDHVVPRITKAAAGSRQARAACRRRRPGRVVPRRRGGRARGLGESGARTRRVLAELHPPARARRRHRRRRPPRRAATRTAVVDRLRSFRDAGATDLAVRVLPLGPDRDARIESRDRTLAFLGSLCPEL